MNKKEQHILEEKIRQLRDNYDEPSNERIEEMKQRAFAEYARRQAAGQVENTPFLKKKGILRRVVAVFAVAVCLLVLPLVYTVLMPVTISNADGIARRVAIWLNDTLQMNITFHEPIEEDNKPKHFDSEAFIDLQTAAQAASIPVVYFDDASVKLDSVEVIAPSDTQVRGQIKAYFQTEYGQLTVSITPILERMSIALLDKDLVEVSTSLGKAVLWENAEKTRCFLTYEEYTIQITGSIERNGLIKLLASITVID